MNWDDVITKYPMLMFYGEDKIREIMEDDGYDDITEWMCYVVDVYVGAYNNEKEQSRQAI